MTRRFDEDEFRAVFQRLQPPASLGRWRLQAPVRRSTRRWWPAGAFAVATSAALVALTFYHPVGQRHPSGETLSPPPSAMATPSAGPPATPTPISSASPPPPAGPTAAPPAAPGWPGPDNTGVPAGTRLTVHDGDLHVTTRGAVVSGLLVKGTVFVEADDVTIRNTRVQKTGNWFAVRQLPSAHRLLIEDSEVDGDPAQPTQYGIMSDDGGLTVRRCHLQGTMQQLSAGGSLDLEDSYLHDSIGNAYPVYVGGGVGAVVVRHNTILNPTQRNAAVNLTSDYGPEVNVVVDRNLVGGGSYALDAGQGPGSREIRITGNHFSRLYSPTGGAVGPVVRWDGNAPGNVWSGNVWDDTGAPVGTS